MKTLFIAFTSTSVLILILVGMSWYDLTGNVNEMEWFNKCKWQGGYAFVVYSQDECDTISKKLRRTDFGKHQHSVKFKEHI